MNIGTIVAFVTKYISHLKIEIGTDPDGNVRICLIINPKDLK